ncbi:sigma factor-like helix-turn-helix DNA-binding protein [Streptomyces sp. NPDC093260]|uniref:RNA polymerase sigma factor n=1 Tax=Streptomyces sp. NPDC093260 TaxID=3155073 RepID=UPI00343A5701
MTDRHANPLPQPVEDRMPCAAPALTRTQSSGTTTTDTRDRPEGPEGVKAGTAGTELTPAQAFDALYAFCAPALVRQAYLLTGRHERARGAVEAAFRQAWQRWPEVAHDRDPAGWVRAATYECALSPWHRLRGRDRLPDAPPDPADRALQDTLLRLPPSYRRTLVLYDGVGLDLPETAAETEASTPATANRLMHAREAVAAHLPELADPTELHRRLVRLGSAATLAAGNAAATGRTVSGTGAGGSAPPAGAPAQGASGVAGVAGVAGAARSGGRGAGAAGRPVAGAAVASVAASVAGPAAVRTAEERSTRFWTRSAIAFTVTIIGATALTLRTAPTHYLAPVSPGHPVRGLPVEAAAGPLSPDTLKQRARLKAEAAGGPERLVPEIR